MSLVKHTPDCPAYGWLGELVWSLCLIITHKETLLNKHENTKPDDFYKINVGIFAGSNLGHCQSYYWDILTNLNFYYTTNREIQHSLTGIRIFGRGPTIWPAMPKETNYEYHWQRKIFTSYISESVYISQKYISLRKYYYKINRITWAQDFLWPQHKGIWHLI